MELLNTWYDYYFIEIADKRVANYPMMKDPLNTFIVIIIYLVTVLYIAPLYMKNRPAYNLKTFLRYYNLFQIIFCAYLVYGILTSGWLTSYSWFCPMVDTSNNPEALRMLRYIHFTYWLKMLEFIETLMFVLRKKDNQISVLHLYHHCSTLFIAWIGVKYYAGGLVSFYAMINHFVHVIMYTYYYLATFGPDMQKRLSFFKSKLTMIQMIQFTIALIHCTQVFHPECKIPKRMLLIFVPYVTSIFYMFYDFYQKAYVKKTSKTKNVKAH